MITRRATTPAAAARIGGRAQGAFAGQRGVAGAGGDAGCAARASSSPDREVGVWAVVLRTCVGAAVWTPAGPPPWAVRPTACPQIGHLESRPGRQFADRKTSPQAQGTEVVVASIVPIVGTISFFLHAGQSVACPATRSRTQNSPPQEQVIAIIVAFLLGSR
jgi:hypothetical protein